MITRTVRRIASGLLVVATLFAQLSVAAYACPSEAPRPAQATAPCEQMDRDQANLCDRHCHDVQQVQGQVPVPVGFVAVYAVALAPGEAASLVREAGAPDLARRVHPPPSISHCRLRI